MDLSSLTFVQQHDELVLALREVAVQRRVPLQLLLQLGAVRRHLQAARQRVQLGLQPAEGLGYVLFEVATVPG